MRLGRGQGEGEGEGEGGGVGGRGERGGGQRDLLTSPSSTLFPIHFSTRLTTQCNAKGDFPWTYKFYIVPVPE
jgi:hypothetical protein